MNRLRRSLQVLGELAFAGQVVIWVLAGCATVLAVIDRVPAYLIPALLGATVLFVYLGVRATIWLWWYAWPRPNFTMDELLHYLGNESRIGSGLRPMVSIAPKDEPELTDRQIDALVDPYLRIAQEVREAAHTGRLRVWARSGEFGALHKIVPKEFFEHHAFDQFAAYLGFAQRPEYHGESNVMITHVEGQDGVCMVDPMFWKPQVKLLWPPKKWWRSIL
ncbi:MAG TPA: hypothetical protein VFX92_06335 [Candidatus Krumholzibacteria bacterium]|nr:hypothetical protein [Candidatus Krumholzibacteria bacterium]